MEHQFGHIEQQRADLVGHVLGRLVVAGIEGIDDLAGGAVALEEVHRTNGIALQADAEQLCLDKAAARRKCVFYPETPLHLL